MDIETIRRLKQEITERFGPWTAHNIRLEGDIYTIDKRIVGDEMRLRRIIQVISDVTARPFRSLRILDLACLEGLFAIELAQQGAKVVAIEGREANIQKARFAKEVLSLDHLDLVQDDVCNLSKQKYGEFDVVLCLGILYHLTVPDVFHFIERIAEVCQGCVVIETETTIAPEESYAYNGRKYWGKMRLEHVASSTPEERANSLWASLDNLSSFCFTRTSLLNVLSHVGFTSVYECRNPTLERRLGRNTLLAIKGHRESLISSPLVNLLSEDENNWAEGGQLHRRLLKIGKLLPESIKSAIMRVLPR
jgi:2-polyprenyl-3-methyl-5-hydroxy-6-metoxy-1,4-benzoquinol methylase